MQKSYPTRISDFPSYACHIKGVPEKIYIKGKLPKEIAEKSLGIVGSRRISPYGVRVLKELFYYVKDTGAVIISGFMAGTDTYAHEFALNSGCTTVAVLPCGCDILHPVSNRALYSRILDEGGAVVSEFEDGFGPKKWTYPKRNRIIAALSKVLLVVEASMKSGSMITACFARRYGRKIFSVPGDIYSERSAGTNRLIFEGAEIYLSAERLIDEAGLYAGERNYSKTRTVLTNNKEAEIIGLLKKGAAKYDKLASELAWVSCDLNAVLSQMLIKGMIFEKGGEYHIL